MTARPDADCGAPPTVACIILAAGLSRRFGAADKLMASVGGAPLVLAPVRAAVAAGCRPVLAVVKPESGQLRRVLAPFPVDIVENPAFEAGLGTSVAAGVRALPGSILAAFVLPGDMPAMNPDVLQRLLTAFRDGGCREVIVPVTESDGERRNPVLWPRSWFGRLAGLDGDRGAKHLIPAPEVGVCRHLAFTGDRSFLDIDTPGDIDG